MAWRSVMKRAGRVALAALVAALVAADTRAPTLDPGQFEAAFQGTCGDGSPCEQLCRELHDGTYECGCGHGYVLHVNGYGCLELNSTKTTEATLDSAEDVLYQKDVSFSAELEVAPSNRHRPTISTKIHITDRSERLATELPDILEVDNYTYTGEKSKEAEGLKSLLEDGISKTDLNIIADEKELQEINGKVTTLGPSLEQKVPGATGVPVWTTAVQPCRCSGCGDGCRTDTKVSTPRFSGASWLALRALRGAYKRVRLRIRFRPERARGVLLLTGEHDDLSGDYLALILRNGHVELRFDCGSGAGVLRSPEPARLGRWNIVSVYRHRWDAWLRLNNGKRVRGRSKVINLQNKLPLEVRDAKTVPFVGGDSLSLGKGWIGNRATEYRWEGLFSRMTFREPVWVGGAGNTTGLQSKLGLSDGLLGCVDFLRINGDTYQLMKDAVATMDIGECAPTLPPWKPSNELTTIEAMSHDDKHAIYDINDIVHFEDNDLVMRDANDKTHDNKFHDDNKLENSIEPFKSYDMKKILIPTPSRKTSSVNDVRNDVKNDDTKQMKTDKDECECQHGGGCVNHVCLCPLGYAGVKCEITLDLKVPRFNGSSYLRLPGLGNSAVSWLDIQITLKPTSGDGLVLYNSEHASGDGDFFSLHLRDYFMEFAFDLGSGIALVRSAYPLEANKWHNVTATRAGRGASLRVATYGHRYDFNQENRVTRWVRSQGGSRRLRLRQPLLLGGAPHPLPPRLALTASFSGCVRQLIINDAELSVVSSALGGLNVDNCEEPNNNGSCTENLCKEIIQMPIYNQNITENEIHRSITPKKGFKLKYHKPKPRKHLRTHLDRKKKKYFVNKKRLAESNEVMTEKPYDGQTYMQIKYLSENEINWVDANTYPSFSGTDSFIHIDDEETMKRLRRYTLDINIRFRSESAHALLVWSGRPPRDFLSLAVEDSVLTLRYDLGSGEVVIIANHTKVDDGLWHRARATRNRQAGVLEVDGLGSVGKISPGKHKQLNTENGLYIGGLPSIEMNTMGKFKAGLIGCVSQISLSGDYDIPLSLSKLPHTITNNVGRCTP